MSNKNKTTALIISSRPPEHSAGLGQSIMDGLSKSGVEVDFITRNAYNEQPSNVIAINSTPIKTNWQKIIEKLLGLLRKNKLVWDTIKTFVNKVGISINQHKQYITNNGITIKYPDENNPAIPNNEIISKIQKKYDFIITLFWQDMLTSASLLEIYQKLKCPILIYSPDMSPMTGGCFYFDFCRNFKNECGNCPGLNSNVKNDKSHQNFLIKKEIYSEIKCAFLGNTWMNSFAKESGLFKIIRKTEIIIDDKIFYPANAKLARKDLNLNIDDEFILLLRSDNHPRKGNDDIKQSLKIFLQRLNYNEIKQVLILSIGSDYFPSISKDLNCKVIDMGFVDTNKLVRCYQSSNFFLNASHDDAGPSMINQSLMCGTPIICYDNGAALDVVINGKSGYKTKTGDIKGFAELISKAHKMNSDDYLKMKHSSREIAMDHNSSKIVTSSLLKVYKELQ